MRFDKLTAYNQYILEVEFCFRVSKYEKFLDNVKVYQAWNKLWSGYKLSAVQPFGFIRFKRLRGPFLTRSTAVRFTRLTESR